MAAAVGPGVADAALEEALRARVTHHPGDLGAVLALAELLRRTGAPGEGPAMRRRGLRLLGELFEAAGEGDEGAWRAVAEAAAAHPRDVELQRSLAELGRRLNRLEATRTAYRRVLAVEPEDAAARHLLAAAGGLPIPGRAADDYVVELFDAFADSFEDELGELDYQAPRHIGDALDRIGLPDRPLRALDLGCGTGLCAPYLRWRASALHGVDLSAGMLAKARARGIYDQLAEVELTAWLACHPQSYDLMVAADVFVYFGDLHPPLAAAAGALAGGGVLAFTVEQALPDDAPPQLSPVGRYAHGAGHIRTAAAAAGLAVIALDAVVLRRERGRRVVGWLTALRRPGL